jgi:hypothetical protein
LVNADPLVFEVGAVHVMSTLVSAAVGAGVELVDTGVGRFGVVLKDNDCVARPLAAVVAVELVEFVSLHPVSSVEASSTEQTIHEPRAPMTRSS